MSHIALGTPFRIRAIIRRLQLGQICHWSRFGSGRWKMQEQMSEQQSGRPGLEKLLLLPVMVLLGMGNYLRDVQYWTAAICHLISSAI